MNPPSELSSTETVASLDEVWALSRPPTARRTACPAPLMAAGASARRTLCLGVLLLLVACGEDSDTRGIADQAESGGTGGQAGDASVDAGSNGGAAGAATFDDLGPLDPAGPGYRGTFYVDGLTGSAGMGGVPSTVDGVVLRDGTLVGDDGHVYYVERGVFSLQQPANSASGASLFGTFDWQSGVISSQSEVLRTPECIAIRLRSGAGSLNVASGGRRTAGPLTVRANGEAVLELSPKGDGQYLATSDTPFWIPGEPVSVEFAGAEVPPVQVEFVAAPGPLRVTTDQTFVPGQPYKIAWDTSQPRPGNLRAYINAQGDESVRLECWAGFTAGKLEIPSEATATFDAFASLGALLVPTIEVVDRATKRIEASILSIELTAPVLRE